MALPASQQRGRCDCPSRTVRRGRVVRGIRPAPGAALPAVTHAEGGARLVANLAAAACSRADALECRTGRANSVSSARAAAAAGRRPVRGGARRTSAPVDAVAARGKTGLIPAAARPEERDVEGCNAKKQHAVLLLQCGKGKPSHPILKAKGHSRFRQRGPPAQARVPHDHLALAR
jgi:hypothetical protein